MKVAKSRYKRWTYSHWHDPWVDVGGRTEWRPLAKISAGVLIDPQHVNQSAEALWSRLLRVRELSVEMANNF